MQIVPEERERLGEGAASDHDLGASARKEIQRRELLENPDRVVGAQHVHGAGQSNPLRPGRRCSQHDSRCRHRVIRPMVLTDPEDLQAYLLGQRDLFEKVIETLARRDRSIVARLRVHFSKGKNAEFHAVSI